MLSDLRFALRALVARPTFTAVAVLALALGTGANTMLFSVVNAVLLRALPFAAPDRLVVIEGRGPTSERPEAKLSPLDVRDLRAGTSVFAAVGAVGFASYDLTGTANPAQTRAALVGEGALEALAMPPLLGRVPDAREVASGAPVVALDEVFWRRHFAADAGVVGRTVTLDGKPYTVVGVLPHVTFASGQEYELWTPAPPAEIAALARDKRGALAFARLAPGVTAAAAREAVATVGRRLAAQYPKENGGWSFHLVAVRDWEAGTLRTALLVLLGAVALVLLIACTNVAHMLLARAAQRQRELGVRAALGASRGRLVRQLLAESAVLAALGTGAGVAIAALLLPALVKLAPLSDVQRAAASLDGRVLLVTLAVALATVAAFGLWPAVAASRVDPQTALRSGGERGSTGRGWRSRGVLVASEVALASVLLAGAALLGKSFEGLLAVDRGYDPTLVVSTGIVLPDNVYPTGASKREFFRAVFERLHATPGVTAAAAVNFLPSYGATTGTALVAGRPESTQPADRAVAWRVATPEYFAALRIPVVRGRGFDESDGPRGVPVAVVNRTLAERWFPGEDAVGKEIALTTWGPPSVVRVVGVTADVRHGGRTEATTPDVFLPYAQQSWGYMNIVVRGQRTTTTALLAALDRAVHAEDPSRPTFAAAVLEEMTDADVAQPKFGAALMGLFAAIAAALACIGVFGVMSHAVAERTREIGIRVALGGTPRQVLGLVMRPGLVLVLAGAATGLALALAGSRVLRSQLYGVRPTDPSVYALVALLMIAIGTAACFLPARRALGVAPTLALKAE